MTIGPKLAPLQLPSLYFSLAHFQSVYRVNIYLHKDGARYTSVRTKARNIVVESYGDVEADVVRDGEQQAIASETSVSAEKDVAVGIL